jgi:hypothetical protein
MGKWNDTDVPLAYLITFRTYGTWLPGDERGSIDRFHNVFRSPRVAPNAIMEEQHKKKLKCPPVTQFKAAFLGERGHTRGLCSSELESLCHQRAD